MEPTSNGQTGNENSPKFKVMLVAAESYDTETAKEKLVQSMNLLAIEFGRFEKARHQTVMVKYKVRNYQSLNAGEFPETDAILRGFSFAGVTILIGTDRKEGFHIYETLNPENSLTIKPSGGKTLLVLSDGTSVTSVKTFYGDFDFSHEGDLKLTQVKNLIVRNNGSEGIFVDSKSVDVRAWTNYQLAGLFDESRRRDKGNIESRNFKLRRSLLGTILLKLGVKDLELIPEDMPEPQTPKDILLDYRVATESIEKMYGLLNSATKALEELDSRNI